VKARVYLCFALELELVMNQVEVFGIKQTSSAKASRKIVSS